MKIVQLANFVSPTSGGIGTALAALGAGYVAAGHRVIQVVPGRAPRRRAVGRVDIVELPSRPVPQTGYRIITDRSRLLRLLEGCAPDRLEVSDKLTLRWVGAWGRRNGIPSLLWTHERLDALAQRQRGVPSSRRALDAVNARIAADFDGVVAPSSWAAQEFRRLGTVPVSVVPLGVDLAMFHPARRDAMVRHRLAAGAPVLVAAAVRLSAEKEPLLLADTLAHLRRSGVDAVMVVAGAGPLRSALERRAADLPLRVLGPVAERTSVATLLATADVVVAPGPAETFGLAALESLACGTPVVGRRCSGVGEVLGGTGATAYGHGRSLAGAVRRLLQQSAPARSAAARTRAEHFPWSRSVAAMLALHGAPPSPTVVVSGPSLQEAW